MDTTLSRLAKAATPTKRNPIVYDGIALPKGCYRKLLTISYKQSDETVSHTLGFIGWRKSDNHKMLFLRDGNSLKLGPKMPQTRKTNMNWLASQFGVPVSRLTLRDKTGLTGPHRPIVGQPIFSSSSIAGGWNLV